jgi:hypothetical protein
MAKYRTFDAKCKSDRTMLSSAELLTPWRLRHHRQASITRNKRPRVAWSLIRNLRLDFGQITQKSHDADD